MFQGEQSFAISMDGADVDVNLSGANARGAAPLFQVRIDQRAEIFIFRIAALPEFGEVEEDGAGRSDGSPDPGRRGGGLLHLNESHAAFVVGEDGVKKFRVGDGEK